MRSYSQYIYELLYSMHLIYIWLFKNFIKYMLLYWNLFFLIEHT